MLGTICSRPASTTSAEPAAMKEAAFSIGVNTVWSAISTPTSLNHPFCMPMKAVEVSM